MVWPFKRKKSTGATLTMKYSTVPEAKAAIQELRDRKKQLGFYKKELNARLVEIRAERSAEIAKQGSKFRGGKGTGRFIRNVQTKGRDADRRVYTDRVNAVTAQKVAVDRDMAAIDRAILQVQGWIARQK